MKEELDPTPLSSVENLYTQLSLNKDSSFEEYSNAIQTKFNFNQLLGDSDPYNDLELNKLKELVVPTYRLQNEKHMNQIRNTYQINFNIPGCVELIDPNRFIENLKPIDEFRHTPVIPISDYEIQKFEEQKRKRKEEPYHIVYTKEKAFSVFIFVATIGLILLFAKYAIDIEESMFVDFRRKKLVKIQQSLSKSSPLETD